MATQPLPKSHQNMRPSGINQHAARPGIMTRIGNAVMRLFMAILIPNRIASIPFDEILNASDATETGNPLLPLGEGSQGIEISDADKKTENWRNSKLQELQFVGLTSALVASLVGAAYSWPSLATAPWSTKATWQASLMLILGAITIATQQSLSLHRYSGSRTGLKTIRKIIRGNAQSMPDPDSGEKIVPSWYLIYVWQLPAMLLRAGIICFIIGTTAMLWNAARGTGGDWSSEDVKVVIVFTVAEVFAIANHFFSVMSIYPRQ